MNNIILSEKMQFLINYSKNQFKPNKGLHLNSADWNTFITVGTPLYYSFLINGIIKYNTKSAISGERYEQIIKLAEYKKMESPLLILFILEIDEATIIDYIAMFLTVSEAKIKCPCDAFLYWGSHYNLSQIDSIYDEPETRPPDIRDKTRNNMVCKHLWLVLNNYEEQIKKFAKDMIPYYKRYFGINSPTGVERVKKQLGIKGIKQMVIQATKDLNKLGNKELLDLYNKLTEGQLNEMFNAEQQQIIEQEEKKKAEAAEVERIKQERENIKKERMKKAEAEKEKRKLEKEERKRIEQEKQEQKKAEAIAKDYEDTMDKDKELDKTDATVKDYDSLMNKKIYKGNIMIENVIKPSDLNVFLK